MNIFIQYKKLFIIVGFIVISLGLLFLLIWIFFIPEKPGPGEPGYMPSGAYLPEIGEGSNLQNLIDSGQLPSAENIPAKETETRTQQREPDTIARGYETYTLPITANKVIGMTLSSNKQGVAFYDKIDQQFYRLSADGKDKIPLSSEKFYNVQDVVWAPDATRAIITYPDGINVFYDFSTKKKVTLPTQLADIEFAPSTDKIGFKFDTSDPDSNFIGVAKPDGTQAQVLEETADQGRFFQVEFSPSEEVAAFYQQPTSANSSEIFLVGQQGENFKSFEINGTRFESKWSPKGTRLLYDVVMAERGFRPMLWTVSVSGSLVSSYKTNLGLYTWVNKCAFVSETEIYCAVPKSMPEGAGLYPESLDSADDVIYHIDLSANRKDIVADPVLQESDVEFKIASLEISSDKQFLFFFDKNSEKIYSIKLK
ncbi:MAG: hypothetical protein ABIF17_00105 [Patescibacteria group bacterium]